MLAENQIYRGDCLELMKEINSESVDFLFTDLPYGTTKAKFDKPIDLKLFWEQVNRITKKNACIALWSQQPYTTDLINSNRKHFRYEWIVESNRATNFFNCNKQPLKSHYSILIFYRKPPLYNPQKTTGHIRKISLAKHQKNGKKSANYNDANAYDYNSTERYPRSVLKFKWPSPSKCKHSQEKPIEACEYFIKTYTNEGALVCDCTTGAGTICVAAQNLKRKFIGFELNKENFQTASIQIIENRKKK